MTEQPLSTLAEDIASAIAAIFEAIEAKNIAYPDRAWNIPGDLERAWEQHVTNYPRAKLVSQMDLDLMRHIYEGNLLSDKEALTNRCLQSLDTAVAVGQIHKFIFQNTDKNRAYFENLEKMILAVGTSDRVLGTLNWIKSHITMWHP